MQLVAIVDRQVRGLGMPYAQRVRMQQELAWCPLAQLTHSETSSIRQALSVVDFADKAAKRGTSNRTDINATVRDGRFRLSDGRQVASNGV